MLYKKVLSIILLLLSFSSFAFELNTDRSYVPENGKVYQITSADSGKLISIGYDHISSNALIRQKNYNKSNGQLWKLIQNPDGTFSFQEQLYFTKCLSVVYVSNENYAFSTNCELPEAKWDLIKKDNGNYIIKNVAYGKVLDVPGASKLENKGLIVYNDNQSLNQEWIFGEPGQENNDNGTPGTRRCDRLPGEQTGDKRLVILIHGYHANSGTMNSIRDWLKQAGYKNDDICNYNYGPDKETEQHISTTGRQFRDYIKEKFKDRKIDIIAHSMGGLVSRYAIKYGIGAQVVNFVALGTPNHGAKWASVCPGPIGGMCTQAVFDMATRSSFLSDLNKGDEAPPPTRFLTYRTPGDEMVNESSVSLNGAINRVVDVSKSSLNTFGGGSDLHNKLIQNKEIFNGILEFFNKSENFKANTLYEIVVGRNGLVVDISDGTKFSNGLTGNNSNVIQYPSNGGINQKWKLISYGGNKFAVQNLGSGMYMTPKEHKFQNGIKIVQRNYDISLWDLYSFGSIVKLIASTTGHLLESQSDKWSHQLNQYYHHGGGSQSFYFREVPELPKKDKIYTISVVHSDKVIDLFNSNSYENAPIGQFYDKNGVSNQAWKLIHNEDGTYSLQVQSIDNNKCMGIGVDNYQVTLRNCNVEESSWIIENNDDGSFSFESAFRKGKFLDVPYSSKEDRVQFVIYQKTNNRNQKFTFKQISN